MVHRVGFIGAGDVVRKRYLPAISQRTDCDVVAICSQHGRSASELAALYGIERVYNDLDQLLQQDDIDTVFICTPTYLHRKMAEAAMARQKNVLIEKPLCTNYTDSHVLLQQAARYSKTFYVAFNNQFRDANQWLRAKVLAGDIGDTELIDFEWYRSKGHDQKAWLYDANLAGGGVLIDLGAHLVHLALSLIPARHQFSAYCNNVIHNPHSSSVDDTSVAMITVDDSMTILIKVGWDMKFSSKTRVLLELFGREGQISNQDYQGPKTNGFGHMIQDFFRHIEAKSTPDLGLVEDTMMLLDALYRSNQTRSTISAKFRGIN